MFRKQISQETGQSMIEYALLAGVLVFAVLSGLSMLGSTVDGMFDKMGSVVSKATLAIVALPEGAGETDDGAAPADAQPDTGSPAGKGNPNAPGLSIAPGQNGTAGQQGQQGQSGAPGQAIAPGGSSNPGRGVPGNS